MVMVLGMAWFAAALGVGVVVGGCWSGVGLVGGWRVGVGVGCCGAGARLLGGGLGCLWRVL